MNVFLALFQSALIVLTAFLLLMNSLWTLIKSKKLTIRLPDFRQKGVFLIDNLFWISVFAWAASGIGWLVVPDLRASFWPVFNDPFVPVQFFGLLLGLSAQLYIAFGFFALGNQFRTSINYGEKVTLVSHGIYKYGRNPMALGMMLQGWASLCLQQTWVTVFIAVGLHVSNRLRVSNEERYLLATLGEEYRDFCKQTNRFFNFALNKK